MIVDMKERRGPLGSKFAIADLLEHGYLSVGQDLVWHRPKVGATHHALVKENGELELEDGRVSSAPSGAAKAAAGGEQDGWRVWKAGEHSLDDLRNQLAEALAGEGDKASSPISEKPSPGQ